MTAPLAGLEALADLCAAGHTGADAVALLTRTGGEVGRWANQLHRSVAGGVELGMALARTQSLTAEELQAVGGPARAGSPVALQAVMMARRSRGRRQRRMRAALLLPGLMIGLTVVPTRILAGMVGAGGNLAGGLVDMLPFGLLWGVVWLAGTQAGSNLTPHLASLPKVGPLMERAAYARVARLLGVSLGPAPTAAVFDAVARFAPGPLAHALGATARRLSEGATLIEAPLPAERVGEGLALAIAVGAGTGTLPERLRLHADAEDEAVDRAAVRAVRLVAWLLLLWVSWRAFGAFGDVDLTQFQPGHVPGMEDPQLNELLKELNM